jgi:hypothetical protein
MVVDEAFRGAIDEAKRLEKRIVEYAPYSGDVSMDREIDLEPADFVDLNYRDMLNMYERTQKIISTASLGILASGAAATKAASAESGEVESKLREMTTETLKTASEVAKEPIVLEKEMPPPQPEAPRPVRESVIEFETLPAREAEKAEEKPEISIELEKEAPAPEAPAARPPAERAGPKVEAPSEKRVIVAAVPPALAESPDQAATKRYEQMEEQIRAAVGERADDITLKKKMLELTKQLFKEKSTSRREEIKTQITVLKNMLAGAQAAGGRAAGGAARKGKDETHVKLYEAMLSAQQGELAQTKDSIVDSYNKQITEIKKRFYEEISGTDDPARRKEIFESFVFSVTSLVEQLPEVLSKYKDFTSKKHAAELEKLRDSLNADEKETRATVEGRLDYIQSRYDTEFSSVKGIVGRDIENLIEVAGSEIFKKAEEKPRETPEARVHEIVREINETDEGTLLYYLHSKDPEYYKRYERKQLSKAETIFKAKELMAKEKGLSETMVKRYFSQMEG